MNQFLWDTLFLRRIKNSLLIETHSILCDSSFIIMAETTWTEELLTAHKLVVEKVYIILVNNLPTQVSKVQHVAGASMGIIDLLRLLHIFSFQPVSYL